MSINLQWTDQRCYARCISLGYTLYAKCCIPKSSFPLIKKWQCIICLYAAHCTVDDKLINNWCDLPAIRGDRGGQSSRRKSAAKSYLIKREAAGRWKKKVSWGNKPRASVKCIWHHGSIKHCFIWGLFDQNTHIRDNYWIIWILSKHFCISGFDMKMTFIYQNDGKFSMTSSLTDEERRANSGGLRRRVNHFLKQAFYK